MLVAFFDTWPTNLHAQMAMLIPAAIDAFDP